jgi:hypothetical protein
LPQKSKCGEKNANKKRAILGFGFELRASRTNGKTHATGVAGADVQTIIAVKR